MPVTVVPLDPVARLMAMPGLAWLVPAMLTSRVAPAPSRKGTSSGIRREAVRG